MKIKLLKSGKDVYMIRLPSEVLSRSAEIIAKIKAIKDGERLVLYEPCNCGSQGTKSYIVKGKGNKQSFESCSHGAGRKMGRKEAERALNLEEEIKKLDNQGILHAIRGIHDLDEASGAYKSIDEVMENQKDLVDILVELTPLGVIKG